MKRDDDLLGRVRVAKPCPVSWETMEGDDRSRHCDLCHLHVYNLSGMTRKEAARLVSESEGRLCVRYYRRADGTILTQDCPVGLQKAWKKLAYALTCAVAMFLSIFAYAMRWAGGTEADGSNRYEMIQARVREIEPIKTVLNRLDPPQSQPLMGALASPPVMGDAVMGKPVLQTKNNFAASLASAHSYSKKKRTAQRITRRPRRTVGQDFLNRRKGGYVMARVYNHNVTIRSAHRSPRSGDSLT